MKTLLALTLALSSSSAFASDHWCTGKTEDGKQIKVNYSQGNMGFSNGSIVIKVGTSSHKYEVLNTDSPSSVDPESSATYQAIDDKKIKLTISDSSELGMSFLTGFSAKKIKLSCQ